MHHRVNIPISPNEFGLWQLEQVRQAQARVKQAREDRLAKERNSGAPEGEPSAFVPGKNPFERNSWNVTAQMAMLDEDRPRAIRLQNDAVARKTHKYPKAILKA